MTQLLIAMFNVVSCHLMYISYRGTDVGVGEDTVDVSVKPLVMCRDNFCMAKPVTRTQPTWTDLILTCDSATNTQVYINI